MADPAIDDFFRERKEAWLKKNLKPYMEETEVREKQLECDICFHERSGYPMPQDAQDKCRWLRTLVHSATPVRAKTKTATQHQ